jgi:hypothetical protein
VPTTTTKTYYYQAFPEVYNWTTYPLTVLLEQMYSQSKSRLATHNMKDTMLVELCSVAERALNYMHTGNAAVIATSVMNPLWIGRAIIQDGMPCINPKYMNIGLSSQLVIYAEQWPYNNSKYLPLTCSNRAQTLTYGETHFKVSAKYIYLFVWHAINSAIQCLLNGGVFCICPNIRCLTNFEWRSTGVPTHHLIVIEHISCHIYIYIYPPFE